MLIAYNNDIEFRSRMYHIQTEDNGVKDGHITTTVFFSGRTLDSKSISYKEAIDGITDTEERNRIIKNMMIKQHQQFYAKLYDGQYEERMHELEGKSRESQPAVRQLPSTQSLTNAADPGQSSSNKTNKPDILRASQQVSNISRPVGIKSFSALSPRPVPPPMTAMSNGVSAGISSLSVPTSQVQRQPGVKPGLSKAVEAANHARGKRAFYGFKWPDEDVAIDALVALLLDSP